MSGSRGFLVSPCGTNLVPQKPPKKYLAAVAVFFGEFFLEALWASPLSQTGP